MNVLAAVTTGKRFGAIATISVFGNDAKDILKNIFQPNGKEAQFEIGQILLGNIIDGEKVIDQVIVACEGQNEFAVSCHGNPLIVELIMELLAKQGVEPVSAEQFLEISNFKSQILNKIAIEAKLQQLKIRTIDGYKLLQNQIENGLSAKAQSWMNKASLEQIKNDVKELFETSKSAEHIIYGAKIVIAGPANSGKSTLLNCMAGREKSIVADIPGTTRDWVSATCINGPLAMELFDTAGLDESLTINNAIDKAAQDRTIELLNKTDVVIWVIDGSKEISNLKIEISKIPAIIVINKSDLGVNIKIDSERDVIISAKNGMGIDALLKKVRFVLGIEGFDLEQAVCFTERQRKLMEKLCEAKDIAEAHSIITELLNDRVRV